MEITKRNHYNPCFWTALWNPTYYNSFIKGKARNINSRMQFVYALSVKSDSIFRSKVDNIHFDKNLGVAEITLDNMKKFVNRHRPEEYDDFKKNAKETDYPLYLDFESILTGIEKLPSYSALLNVIRGQNIVSIDEKAFLASFIYYQYLRSHAIMNSSLEWGLKNKIEKFEYFVLLKWHLANTNSLFQQVAPITFSEWTLYKLDKDTFPLTDSPVLIGSNGIMVSLSPRLLLETSRIPALNSDGLTIKNGIDDDKLNEFRIRTIGNTFREIIFSDKELLKNWQETKEFQYRVETIKRMKSYNDLMGKDSGKEFWKQNTFDSHKKTSKSRKRTRKK